MLREPAVSTQKYQHKPQGFLTDPAVLPGSTKERPALETVQPGEISEKREAAGTFRGLP